MRSSGWAICDGAELAVTEFPDLFAAIGTSNGGGHGAFNIPDYRGYFLRGVDPLGAVDPNASSRGAAKPGGATGNRVGSVQAFSTALPRTPFEVVVPNIPSGSHDAYYGGPYHMLEPGGARHFGSAQGGDDETRPVNAYVNFIIKLEASAPIPTGAVVAFAGSNGGANASLERRFELCDGTLLEKETHKELFDAIGSAHGESGEGFNLPDYRGRFMRGVDDSARRDPDASKRGAMAQGGAAGDTTGSIQTYATAKPATPFDFTIALGTDEKHSDICAGHNNARWNSGSVDVPLTNAGGDHETRPINASVDYYILSGTDPNNVDVFPVGGVMAFPGGAKPNQGQWLLCDGSQLPVTAQFAGLYAAIGCTNGGDGEYMFNLPAYQGMFLRGTDHGQQRDPDAGERLQARSGGNAGDQVGSVQGYATAKPRDQAISTSVPHLPVTHTSNAAAVLCSQVSGWGGTQTVELTGGDAESRPINAYVFFYIKYAQAHQG